MSDQDKAAFGRYTTGRKYQAAKKRAEEADVNLLKDPKTYAVVSGLLGTAPDELGFSVLHPEYEAIQRVAEPAFGVGTLLGVAPALAPITKGLPVGASIKSVTSPQKTSRGLYSKVDEVAGLLTREKGTGAEFLKEIQKTPGVKAAEIKDRKLDKVLPAMGKTTKADVMKALEQNPPPKLEETVLGSKQSLPNPREMEDALIARAEQLQAEGNDAHTLDMLLRGESADRVYRQMRNDAGMIPDDFAREVQDWHAALVNIDSPAVTKYGQYTIPGGENYREILLRLPVQPKEGVSVTQTGTGRWRVTFPDGSSDLYRTEQEAMANAGGRGSYHSTHWDEPQVLAHARVADRIGPNGEKILHVEEIQSDWHQAARKTREDEVKRIMKEQGVDKKTASAQVPENFGYQDPNVLEQKAQAEAARAEAKKVLDEAQEKVRAAKSYVSQYEAKINSPEFQNAPPEYQQSITALRDRFTQAWMRDLPELMKAQKAYDELPDPATMKTAGVPDAPFKKNWHELTMKRILDYATEKGYDKIAITPGAEQANRYKLSSHIDNMMVSDTYQGTRQISWRPTGQATDSALKFDEHGNVVQSMLSDLKGKNISDVFGKDLAEKIMQAKPYQRFEGVDLDIGGEGMKGFYDQILPTYLNDLGKPYGATVGEMRLPAPPKDSSVVSGYTLGDEYMQGRATWSEFLQANPRAAEEFSVPVHTFDITPEMRQSIQTKGLPLYQQVGVPTGAGLAEAMQQEPVEQMEPEYRQGGKVRRKVRISSNPDTMRLELMSRSR